MELVDSHCHLDFPDLSNTLEAILEGMRLNQVAWALCPGVTMERFPEVLNIATAHPHLYAAVGVHPDTEEGADPSEEELIRCSTHARVVAIGETGLDYYRLKGDIEWQRDRFRRHIRAARKTGLPLIIHTRSAAEDTLRILREEGAQAGVFHCFTESLEVAKQAVAMGFYLSFSGILTFKNADVLREVARWVPDDRLLVETDAPYLAPVPYRGKRNEPAYVRHVAEALASVREVSLEQIAALTTRNFFTLFSKATVSR